MSELEDKISEVLGDPEQMARITKLAQSLMGGGETNGAASASQDAPDAAPHTDAGLGALGLDAQNIARLERIIAASGAQNREETALLEAMKPYLSEKRRGKMDRAMKLAKLTRIARLALSEEENGHA